MRRPGAHSSAEVIKIGLDVGTTATKAVAFELGTDWRYTALREYPLSAPQPGWQVQDPRAISTAVVEALAECVAAVGDAPVIAVAVVLRCMRWSPWTTNGSHSPRSPGRTPAPPTRPWRPGASQRLAPDPRPVPDLWDPDPSR